MGENYHSSVEEIVSIEDGGNNDNCQPPIAFSKKAIHQRDADENLFLRFLELDPPLDTSSNASNKDKDKEKEKDKDKEKEKEKDRRLSMAIPIIAKPILGRTPFTITKRLTRTSEKGFGFSIVWTHPPRVEKVEPGLSADLCGIVPGDYVIFVEKHNVVTMPEVDILNLIKSQGNTLLLEIFRRSSRPSNGINSRMPILSSYQPEETLKPVMPKVLEQQIFAPRSSTACSNVSLTLDTATKRRLNLPQVTFSKEVGLGVIV